MPLQAFVDNNLPTVKAAWLNAIDVFYFTLFNSATTAAGAMTALGFTATGQSLIAVASAAAGRIVLGAAASGANTDITSLSAPALGAATATTQSAADSSTKVATTAFGQGEFVNKNTTRTANTILAGPTTGGAAAPTFRALVAADMPGTLTAGTPHIMNPYALSTESHTAHGLGAIPSWGVKTKMECLSTDAGYAAAAVIYFDTSMGGGVTAFVSYADATNVGIVTHDTLMPAIPHFTTQANTNIDVTKWKITITPYKIN